MAVMLRTLSPPRRVLFAAILAWVAAVSPPVFAQTAAPAPAAAPATPDRKSVV